jgi:predicted secreted protein
MLSVIATPCTAAANRNADPGPGHDQVEFTVEVGEELVNDLAEVVLATQVEDHDPARVAGEINATMNWALNQVHGVADIAATSGSYQTYPVYDKTRLDHWRGSQTLVLRSKRIEALNTLVGSLQQRLQVQNMRFTISPDQQQASESRLIDQALDRFKARALRIQQRLGAAGYDIVHLTVGTSGHPPPMPMETMAMARAASRPALAGEAGTSRQTLRIHAVIQLRF